MKKAYDDAIVALYQNGERIMPGNGYPMRLLLPGYEGNMNIKFLRRIKVIDQPAMTYYESRNYSPLLPDGKAYKFYFVCEVKSFITRPSFGYSLKTPGFYEISGIAYSGTGRIQKVEVSADGGKSWGEAAVEGPVSPQAFTRFRHAVALGRPAGDPDQPRLGRFRRGAAAAAPISSPCAARRRKCRMCSAFPTSITTASPHGASRQAGRSNMSTFKPLAAGAVFMLAFATAVGNSPPTRRISASRSPKPTSRPGTSACCPTAPICRPAAAPRRKAPRCIVDHGCNQCHGDGGKGGTSNMLVGNPPLTKDGITSNKTIANFWAYPTTLFDYVRRAMPWPTPHTLTDDEVYAICAYLFAANKLIPQDQVMNAQTLPKVKMPNHDNFIIRFPDRI